MNTMRKFFALSMIALLAAFAVVGCAQQAAEETPAATETMDSSTDGMTTDSTAMGTDSTAMMATDSAATSH